MLLLMPSPAGASVNQRAIFEDDDFLLSPPPQTSPSKTLKTLRQLGVSTIRLTVPWRAIAPTPRPLGFNARDPASYPPGKWAPYDRVIRDAHASGIEVDLLVTGGAPSWARPPGPGPYGQWKPSASGYGQFFRAVATRYSGHYGGLPRVGVWEIWNEENWGQDLAPQAPFGSTVSVSPGLYRPLLDAGWGALQSTGHGRDTIVIGSLSPRGEDEPGNFATTKPLKFLRALYCVDSSYHQLRGGGAAVVGCPTTARGSRGFRSAHPALFKASGVAIHPYPYNLPPTQADSTDPDFVEFSELPRLEATVSHLQHVYRSRAVLSVYNTEYSYETDPPNHSVVLGGHFVAPQTAASYINWAEYLSWKKPWIQSYSQFLLYDPPPDQGASLFGIGGFAAGLVFATGNRPKATYGAYRMPIFMPVTSTRRGRRLEVWGCVRPAHVAHAATGLPQFARIQLNGRTVMTVPIRNSRGYFDVRVKFPSSGTVRMAWSYPLQDQTFSGGYTDPLAHGATVYSRSIGIRIH